MVTKASQTKPNFLKRNLGLLVTLLVLACLPFIVGLLEGATPIQVWQNQGGTSKFVEGLAIEVFILAIFALSYDLLFGITEGLIRIAMCFDDQSVKIQVHGFLGDVINELPVPAYMAGIGDDGHLRDPSAQLNGYLPLGNVPVYGLIITGKTTVDGSQLPDAGIVDPFYGTDPEIHIRIDWIFHQDRDVDSPEAIGNVLNSKGICRGPGSYPDDVHPIFQGLIHMFHIGHLGGYQHAGLLLNRLHPFEPDAAYAFEGIGPGPWLPDPRPEDLYPHLRQRDRRIYQLFLGLGTAWACHDNRFAKQLSVHGDGFQRYVNYHNFALFNY